jgi:hypothetical protein
MEGGANSGGLAETDTKYAEGEGPAGKWGRGGSNRQDRPEPEEGRGFGRSMWRDQCNLPIYGGDVEYDGGVEPYLQLGASVNCWWGGDVCDFSSIQRPTDPAHFQNACGG